MIEQAQRTGGDGLDRHPALPRRPRQPRRSTSRARASPRPRAGASRRARSSARRWCSASTTTTASRSPRRRATARRCRSGTLDFLEEPIRDETPEAYEALRRMTDVPFAIGEEFASKWQFLPYIERDIHQFNRIDVCNVGGLTEAMKVAGWSEAHYVDMMPHNPLGPICTAATLHFAAAVAELRLARDPRLAGRALPRLRRRRDLPGPAAARRRRLSGARRPGPRRRGRRGAGPEAELQVLGSAPPAPHRRLRDQLVGPEET